MIYILNILNGHGNRNLSRLESTPKPEDIPANPNKVYKDSGWKSWGDWFGTGTIATSDRVYWPFPKARAFVHKLGLKGEKEWFLYTQGKLLRLKSKPKPEDIPSYPNICYAKLRKRWQLSSGAGKISDVSAEVTS